MGNLFAYRATDPQRMKLAANPIGPRNDSNLKKLADQAEIIVAAWGNHGSFMQRSTLIKKKIGRLHILELNSSGEPKHPLYVKADTNATPWIEEHF